MTEQCSLADIVAAREMLEGLTVTTPMEESRWLSALVGGPVSLKCENLQRTGSFKSRGAFVRISRLSAEERANGVVAASRRQPRPGCRARRLDARHQLHRLHARGGADPQGEGDPRLRRRRRLPRPLPRGLARAAREFADETGAVLIHPFDHVDIVAGQGTLGLEVLEQAPDVRTVLVPTGGGGLLAGVAIAIKALRPDVRVVGVQAEGAAAYPGSLAAGEPVPLESMSTMADGIAVGRPGDITFAAVRDHVDEIVTVSEESLSRALLALIERAKQVVEPAGAAAVAALLDNPTGFETPAVAVLSGGNIDPLLLSKVIRHGLAAAGRYLYLRVCIPDLPGGLASLLAEVGAEGANVLEVAHERISPSLTLNEVEVRIQLETRGEAHAEHLMARLRERGYRVDN